MENTVSNHFLAALGLEQGIDKLLERRKRSFCHDLLKEYRQEAQYERARLMRAVPCDYQAVRKMDRELEDVIWQLQQMACADS